MSEPTNEELENQKDRALGFLVAFVLFFLMGPVVLFMFGLWLTWVKSIAEHIWEAM